MTNEGTGTGRDARRARRLKTWSQLGNLGRMPTEYEVVTHGMNHTMSNTEAPLEMGISNFGNQWLLRHRDGVPLAADGWDGFRDPDAMTYRKYNKIQDDAETYVDELLEELTERRGIDRSHSVRWLDGLATLLTPQRYPVHGLQMVAAYIAQVAPSSYIVNTASFQTSDELRRVQRIAYRTKQLALAHEDRGFGEAEREIWESRPGWQPTREAIERLLVVYDWDEAFAACNLVIKPTFDALAESALSELAREHGDELDALLLDNLAKDSERSGRWSTALARHAIELRAANRDVLHGHVQKWTPVAEAMAESWSEMLASFSDHARTASAARERVGSRLAALHREAGIG